MNMSTSAFSLTSAQWASLFKDRCYPVQSLSFWLDGLYKDQSIWNRHIAASTLSILKDDFNFELPQIARVLEASDGTIKFQMRFPDQQEVETVLIPFFKRYTVCLSTQVGCGMNCSFCYTGTQGLKRHLSAGEIVGQYLVATSWLMNRKPNSLKPSIVFMGQGEPLHNATEVRKAIEVLNDPQCVGVGHRQMTLSTVGYLPGMQELLHFPKINLALSLHSPFDEQRSELIPVNQRFPLDQVLQQLDQLPLLKRQFITYEYLMIQNYNMTEDHVSALAELLSHRRALINLIPFNPFPGSKWARPTADEIEVFKNKLVEKKLRVMVRQTKGDDILAACGQLKINEMARNYER